MTSSSASRWPATSSPMEPTGRHTPCMADGDRLPRPVTAIRVRLGELSPFNDSGYHRHDRPGVPRPDDRLRPLPRPQVRPHYRPRLLRPVRDLRQHSLPLRRLGAEARHEVHGLAPPARRGRSLAGHISLAAGRRARPVPAGDRNPRRHRWRLRAPEAVGRREPRLPRHALVVRGAARRDRRGPESVHQPDASGWQGRGPLPRRCGRSPGLATHLAGPDCQHNPVSQPQSRPSPPRRSDWRSRFLPIHNRSRGRLLTGHRGLHRLVRHPLERRRFAAIDPDASPRDVVQRPAYPRPRTRTHSPRSASRRI